MEWLNAIVAAIVGLIGALGGGSVIYWRATRKSKEADAHKSTTEARLAEADFAEKILQKYEQGILARMDSGDAVRKQEFQELERKIDHRFDIIEAEDRKQNETMRDIVEYLNGGFQEFEREKHKNDKKKPSRETARM